MVTKATTSAARREVMTMFRTKPEGAARGRWFGLALLGVGAWAASCHDAPEAPAAEACAAQQEPIDRFKELVVVDEDVLAGGLGSNRDGGPLSFRHLVEQLAPPGASPDAFVRSWLGTFTREQRVTLYPVPARPFARARLICPWLRRTPANACNDDCSACAAEALDLALAPFRLIGLSNRIDFRETKDWGGAGESRALFALVDGLGDDPAAAPQAMTVAFEFRNPISDGRDAKYWAERWHALGRVAAPGPAYAEALTALYGEIVAHTSDPAASEGSWLHQLRTNESVLDEGFDYREFKLKGGVLTLWPTERTPDRSLNGSSQLAQYVLVNRDDIARSRYDLPANLTGGFARPLERWALPGVDETLRHAFARETCDGCHNGENPSVDVSFHISPFRRDRARLSPYLHDPSDPTNDTLARREGAMRRALCGQSPAESYNE
jgi:hypothetical protein